jgi:hypothetical protein
MNCHRAIVSSGPPAASIEDTTFPLFDASAQRDASVATRGHRRLFQLYGDFEAIRGVVPLDVLPSFFGRSRAAFENPIGWHRG